MQIVLMAMAALSISKSAATCVGADNLTLFCSYFNNDARDATELTITSNCSMPQSSAYSTESLTLTCEVSELHPFWLSLFPNLRHLSLPNCNLSRFAWQAFSMSRSLTLDHSCPLSCSCVNAWMSLPSSTLRLFSLPSVPHLSCDFSSCPIPSLTPSSSFINTTMGSSLHLNVSISSSNTLSVPPPRPYFGWMYEGTDVDPKGEETVSDSMMVLSVDSLKEDHLGTVVARCWHCPYPVYSLVKIEMPVSAHSSLTPDPRHPHDTSILHIRGHPLDNLTLSLMLHDERSVNETVEELPLGQSTIQFLNGALAVKPLPAHFPYRLYQIFTAGCSFCDFDHPTGNFSFRLCENGECTVLMHQRHLLSVPNDIPFQPRSSSLWTLLLLLPLLLFLSTLTFLLVVKTRKIRAKVREGRRESGGTEETRMEERSSMASDYAHITLPTLELGDIQMHEKIGFGAFGEVFRASLNSAGGLIVAVKVIKEVDEKEAKEAALLSRLSHQNVVRLFGTSRDSDRLLLIFEMMALGDLRTYVADRRPRPGQYTQFPPALEGRELVEIVRQIVKGMRYLCEMGVVHRDLAARNCLVTGQSDRHLCMASSRPPITVKISDFGMSRRLYSHSEYYRMQSASCALPVRWLPPEALNTGIFNMHTDIWALGVTIWEVYSFGALPFADLSTQELLAVCMAGVRPPQPIGCPQIMYDLCLRCWEKIGEERITPQQALLHEALRLPSDDLSTSTSTTSSAWTHNSEAPLIHSNH